MGHKQKMTEEAFGHDPTYAREDADTELLQLSGSEYIEVERTPGYIALSKETARLETTFLYHGQWLIRDGNKFQRYSSFEAVLADYRTKDASDAYISQIGGEVMGPLALVAMQHFKKKPKPHASVPSVIFLDDDDEPLPTLAAEPLEERVLVGATD